MPLTSFLYRYIFRGIGLVLLTGMLTMLILAIRSQLAQPKQSHPAADGSTPSADIRRPR